MIIIGFLVCLMMALWLFFSRETTSLRENMENAPSHKKPRVILENFITRRYKGETQLSQMRADYGDFRAPNVVEIKSGLSGWQLSQGRVQTMKAGRGVAWFDASSLSELLEGNKGVDHAFLRERVQIGFQEHLLITEEAQYVTKESLITGQMPVRVTGPGRWFTGKDGFRYDLKDETFNVYGKVRGMVRPDASEGN